MASSARELGLPHRLVTLPSAPERFGIGIREEGLTHSPGSGASSGLVETLAGLNPRVASGYVMDPIVGGSHIEWCYSVRQDRTGFDRFFSRLTGYGIRVEVLRRLLRPDVFGDSLDQVLHQVRQSYESVGTSDLERAWHFDLRHRQRFHTGSMLWRHTFGAWPAAPCLDREVLDVAANLPLALLAGRRLERDILTQSFPRLASLPLDRNSFNTTPLKPRLRHLARRAAADRFSEIASRLGIRRRERRYYYRTFDFDGPTWRAVRQAIEPSRDLAYALFDRRAFDEIVPGPDQTWAAGDTIVDAAGIKLLLGVVSWLSQPDPGRAEPPEPAGGQVTATC